MDQEKAKELFHQFDNMLNLAHFLRSYSDKSGDLQTYQDKSLEEVFSILGKDTEEEQKINCFCCGYGSCRSFALAIATMGIITRIIVCTIWKRPWHAI